MSEYKNGDIYSCIDTNEVILFRECGNGIMEWITASQDNWVGLHDRQFFITNPEFYTLIYREGVEV